MRIIFTGAVGVCVYVCVFVFDLAFPEKFDLSKQGASHISVEWERERERERNRVRSVWSSEKCEYLLRLNPEVLGRKLIFSQTYFFLGESDPTIVASSEGLIIQQRHCAMSHFPLPNLERKKEFKYSHSQYGWVELPSDWIVTPHRNNALV